MINKRKEINHIRDKLIQRGYKLTKARLKIIEVFCENDCLMYADEIYKRVRIKSVGHSISTIYRNIAILEQIGVLKKIYISNTCYYKLEKTEKHVFNIHAKCVKCNKIIDINEEEISENLDSSIEKFNRKQKNEIKSTNVILSGVCKECEMIP
ncbi:MAG TPA: transcriptional repressor [Clostridium sp.]|uniref:Fur family transcriptional regulator n=1 Tax=Clostridium sp. TaxID=1506 RepID=UPI002F9307FE